MKTKSDPSTIGLLEQGVDSFSTIVLHLKRPVLPDLGNLSLSIFGKNFFFDMAVFFILYELITKSLDEVTPYRTINV